MPGPPVAAEGWPCSGLLAQLDPVDPARAELGEKRLDAVGGGAVAFDLSVPSAAGGVIDELLLDGHTPAEPGPQVRQRCRPAARRRRDRACDRIPVTSLAARDHNADLRRPPLPVPGGFPHGAGCHGSPWTSRGIAAASQRVAQGMPARGPLLAVRGVTGQLHVSNAEPLAQRVVAAMTENRCFAQRRDPVLEGPSEAVRDHHDVAAADLAEPEATVTSRADRPRPPQTGRPGDTRGLHAVPRDAGRVGDRRVQLQ